MVPVARAAIKAFVAASAQKAQDAASSAAKGQAAATTAAEPVVKAAEPKAGLIPSSETAKIGLEPKKSKFNFKTPGKIAALLIFILFIVFTITPAPGHSVSRLRLIWETMIKGGTFTGTAAAATSSAGITQPDTATNVSAKAAHALVDSKLFYI